MREQSIFIEALGKEDPAEREAFLDRACAADPALRPRIERLFRRHEQADDLLDAPPAWAAATLDQPIAEGPGTVIGPYKLLEAIGEGGMGTVYMAEQSEPVRRRVALKVIKQGMDTRQVVARFEAERQALAMMDHPNIARVLDAGTTAAGRPYFVMELVRGLPITEYCDREQVPIRERLELFTLVCRAVQHAHQKGIIHRDLKPSNILVTVIDGAAVPKVIDFGVAKATGGHLTDRTLFTGFHQFIGTPLYVSPEQADLAGVDVDTRSDIYSLGVLLYELLTGTTPFDPETLRRAAFDEMRRMIREDEPPKPSTRLGSLGERLSTVSASRKADPRRLGASMKGELDWVVMKALEKDRSRRYETANDFAADVMRYLTDRPVEAFPPSSWYRFGKFARRNRVALTTAAVVGLAMAAGTAASVWQGVKAFRAERRAEVRYQLARRAVDEMYTEVAEKWLAQQPKLTQTQRGFLEKALAFYEQFAREEGTDPEARSESAGARLRVGLIQRTLGMFARSEASFRQTIEQLEELAARFPGRPDYLKRIADCNAGLAGQLVQLDRPREAEPILRRSVAIMETLVAKDPTNRDFRVYLGVSLRNLGNLYERQGRNADAEIVLRRAADLHPDGNALAVTLGNVYQNLGRLPEAEEVYLRAVERLESFLAKDPGNRERRAMLSAVLAGLAAVQCDTGRLEEGIANDRRSVALSEGLVDEFPDVLDYRQYLLVTLQHLCFNLSGTGRDDEEAERFAVRYVELGETLVRDHPAVPYFRELLAKGLGIAAVLSSLFPEKPFHNPALALKRSLRSMELAPEQKEAWQCVGWAQYRLGDWKGCVTSLEKWKGLAEEGDYFGAMAYWRLGDKAKAHDVFHRTDGWLAGYEKRWTPKIVPSPAMLRGVRAEAAALLGVVSPDAEVRPKTVPRTITPAR